MTRDEIRERGTRICDRLTEEVAAITPEGIRSWPEASEIVTSDYAEFMIALTAWESDPSESAKAQVRVTYEAVLAAWREAAARFEEAGR